MARAGVPCRSDQQDGADHGEAAPGPGRVILRTRAARGEYGSPSIPGLSATVGEQIEALRRVAGDRAVALIRREPDPGIAVIGRVIPPGRKIL